MNDYNPVILIKTNEIIYPGKADCFRPDIEYPEYLFKGMISKTRNNVYSMIRDGFLKLGYDFDNFGTEFWNPLGQLINPGDKVLIKPNLVMDVNRTGMGVECLYTHPALVAAIIDYVMIALKGHGEIVIGDAPMQECNFEKLITESGYKDLLEFYLKNETGVMLKLIDFRELKSKVISGIHHSEIIPDARGTIVDLADESEFSIYSEFHLKKLRITNYDPNILNLHHTQHKHEYYISNYVLNSNVIINMPKPKTHRKAGVTISLKNLVGINVRKEFLPHHTVGDVCSEGDEYKERNILKEFKALLIDKKNIYSAKKNYSYANLCKYAIKILSVLLTFSKKDRFSEGSWHGNQTISKTTIDLNKILLYADKNGVMQSVQQRKMLIVADMIISGEKEGPVLPTPKAVGLIAFGTNPVCFDEVIATLMGANITKIPTLLNARNVKGSFFITTCSQAIIISNEHSLDGKTLDDLESSDILYFIPTSGWTDCFN